MAIPLAPVASSEAPLSRNTRIALPTEETACVIDDYEVRVHCIHRDQRTSAIFGRRGEGPGEFPESGSRRIVRGRNATIGVVTSSRLSVFDVSGELLSDIGLPRRLMPSAPFDSILSGYYLQLDYRPPYKREYRAVDLDIRSGAILWERVYPRDMAAGARCPGPPLPEGVAPPRGLATARFLSIGAFFILCRGQLLFLEDRRDEGGTLIQAPLYADVFPSPEDVERYVELCDAPARRLLEIPCEPEEYARTPENYSAQTWVDDQDRLWALTNRDRESFSHLDVFIGLEFAGSVRVRHRAVGFDVLGTTLVILVDHPVGTNDPDGIPDRGIDWYDIGELELGVGDPGPHR